MRISLISFGLILSVGAALAMGPGFDKGDNHGPSGRDRTTMLDTRGQKDFDYDAWFGQGRASITPGVEVQKGTWKKGRNKNKPPKDDGNSPVDKPPSASSSKDPAGSSRDDDGKHPDSSDPQGKSPVSASTPAAPDQPVTPLSEFPPEQRDRIARIRKIWGEHIPDTRLKELCADPKTTDLWLKVDELVAQLPEPLRKDVGNDLDEVQEIAKTTPVDEFRNEIILCENIEMMHEKATKDMWEELVKIVGEDFKDEAEFLENNHTSKIMCQIFLAFREPLPEPTFPLMPKLDKCDLEEIKALTGWMLLDLILKKL